MKGIRAKAAKVIIMKHSTIKEAILQQFTTEVLKDCKKLKLSPTTVLDDYSIDKNFAKEWGDMLSDRIERLFGISMKRIRNKSVHEILKHVEIGKKKFNSLPPGLQIHLSKGKR